MKMELDVLYQTIHKNIVQINLTSDTPAMPDDGTIPSISCELFVNII